MPRIVPISFARSSASTTAPAISPAGPVIATVSGACGRALFAAAMHWVVAVALVVVTLGANRDVTGLAAAAAGLAACSVLAAGVLARRPLARVPENVLKYAVGVMLCAFGIFWSAEGAGLHWPGGEAMLP